MIFLISPSVHAEEKDGSALIVAGATASAVAGVAGTVAVGLFASLPSCGNYGDCWPATVAWGGLFAGASLGAGVVGITLLVKGLRAREARHSAKTGPWVAVAPTAGGAAVQLGGAF